MKRCCVRAFVQAMQQGMRGGERRCSSSGLFPPNRESETLQLPSCRRTHVDSRCLSFVVRPVLRLSTARVPVQSAYLQETRQDVLLLLASKCDCKDDARRRLHERWTLLETRQQLEQGRESDRGFAGSLPLLAAHCSQSFLFFYSRKQHSRLRCS